MANLNVQNRTLFHGDNLPFLRGINSGTNHLTATDPPFDRGLILTSNRLLCGLCNRNRSDRLSLSGLRAENEKRGRVASKGG